MVVKQNRGRAQVHEEQVQYLEIRQTYSMAVKRVKRSYQKRMRRKLKEDEMSEEVLEIDEDECWSQEERDGQSSIPEEITDVGNGIVTSSLGGKSEVRAVLVQDIDE